MTELRLPKIVQDILRRPDKKATKPVEQPKGPVLGAAPDIHDRFDLSDADRDLAEEGRVHSIDELGGVEEVDEIETIEDGDRGQKAA